jgi:uncharacterized protein YfkK (UPF0435 family)
MNATIITPEKLAEIKRKLELANGSIIKNSFAKNQIQETLKLLGL